MLRLSFTLFCVALCCGLILAFIYHHTAPVIEKQKQILLEQSLNSVLTADKYEKYQNGMVYYEALNDKDVVVGWCLPLGAKGYGGDIQLLVGVDINGKITGVKVLEHKETPGLGSQINEIGYKQTEPEFLKRFKGKKTIDLVLIKGQTQNNIQAITGATISSKAVLDTVKEGIEQFLEVKKEK